MATPPKPRQAAGSRQQAARTGGPQRQQGIYVYGIVPAEVELGAEVPGVGDPPGLVRVARCRDLAALISGASPSRATQVTQFGRHAGSAANGGRPYRLGAQGWLAAPFTERHR